jgi:hypothetical protein
MPYLGNVPAEAYSQMSYQDLTGGSGTSFTLDYPVGNENEIEVFVNNVRQEPTVAYTTAGTALTMTGTIAATDDFYVVFQGKAQQTIGIPEKQTNGDYNFSSNTLYVDASTSRVGVGETSPTYDLSVTNTDGEWLYLKRTGGAELKINASGSAGFIGTTTNYPIALQVNSSEIARITSNGITFNGDTAAANALDDYEEGTFTPTFTAQSSNPTVTYDTQLGNYIKIGNTVYFSIHMGTGAVSGGSGDLYISGFPFTSSSTKGSRSGAWGLNYTWNTNLNPSSWWIAASDTKIYLYQNNNAASTVTVANMGTGSSANRLWLQGFYTTDA